jgi:hypothetical protein
MLAHALGFDGIFFVDQRQKPCHSEDFENAGVIFGAGMTEATNRRYRRVPWLKRSGGSASPRTMLGLARRRRTIFSNALGDRVPPGKAIPHFQ